MACLLILPGYNCAREVNILKSKDSIGEGITCI